MLRLAFAFFALGLVALLACNSPSKEEKSNKQTETSSEWRSGMHELSHAFSELLPLTFNQQSFVAPANEQKIGALISKVQKLGHSVEDMANKEIFKDPSLALFADEFDQELTLAKRSFESGHKDYSRSVLRDTMSLCIQCHTRTAEGPHFLGLDLGTEVEKMSLLSQAEFFAATRQFSRALDTYKEILSDQTRLTPMEWEKASLHALAIAIRYLRSPEQALEIVKSLETSKDSPYYVKRDIKTWEKAINDWQQSWTQDQKLKNEAQLKKANQLLSKAKTKDLADSASAIEYLRASALLHEYLSEEHNSKNTAEALFNLGQAYAGVRQFNMPNIEEGLFESCIRKAPHSPIAGRCFEQYKDGLLVGFSGSGGLSLPPDVQKRMNHFEKLAGPKE